MSPLAAYRDDGPLARLLAATIGRRLPAGSFLPTLVGAVPLIVVLGRGAADPDTAQVGLALAWFVTLAGAASAWPTAGRLGWLVPPLLRAVEYGFFLRVTALAHPTALPMCFALLAVVAYHHYDTVYRIRHQRIAPPQWLQVAAGGWDLRLLLGFIALVAVDRFDVALGTGAVLLGTLYATESVLGWLRFEALARQRLREDEVAL
jgi:hypothetical protein